MKLGRADPVVGAALGVELGRVDGISDIWSRCSRKAFTTSSPTSSGNLLLSIHSRESCAASSASIPVESGASIITSQ